MTARGTPPGRSHPTLDVTDSDSDDSDSLRNLLAPGIKLVLIKGAPGTGKTSLAMRLLEYLESGAYISSRVGLEKLSKQNPQLLRMERKGRLERVSLETQLSETTTLRTRDSTLAATGTMEYEDARLGNPGFILSQVIKATSSDRELIVLDSWDTMAKEMDRIDRLKAEKSIAAIVDASEGSRVVLISEEPELTSTDYMVDAIVTLGYVELGHLRLREIAWEKLRGRPILDRKRIFTLKDGRLALMPKPNLATPNPRRFKPIPDTGTHYSTGSRDLDGFLGGGIKHGMNILLEEGATLGNDWHRPMYGLIRSNFLLNHGGCIMVPSPTVTPTMVIEATASHVGQDALRSSLRIISHMPQEEEQHPSVVDVSGKSMDEVFQVQTAIAQQLRREHPHILWLLDMDTFEIFAGAAVRLTSYMARGTTMIRQSGDAHIMMAKPSTAGLQMLSDNYDLHLKLEERDGTLILYGKRPPTDGYGVSYDHGKGYPQVHLTKMI